MVFSELLLAIPYKIVNSIKSLIIQEKFVYFYIENMHDYFVMKNIIPHFPNAKIGVKNKSLQIELAKFGINSEKYPIFPSAVIMARHALHKFPDSNILKIGMRHGPYHFKDFISPKKYNKFDLFLFTSETEAREAAEIGINCGAIGGYSKLDEMYLESNLLMSQNLKKHIFNNSKPTILFSATWEKSGLSAVDKWFDKLEQLTDKYNVLVTLHAWCSDEIKSKIKNTQGVYFIDSYDNHLFLLMADVMIADTSSIIGEFNTLNKPIITFKIPQKGRLPQQIVSMLDEMTYRIEKFEDLIPMIDYALHNSIKLAQKRKYYNGVMLHQPLGNHAKKASDIINETLRKSGFVV